MPNYGNDQGQGYRGGRERDEYGRFRSEDEERGSRHSSGRGEPFGGYEGRAEGGYRSSHMQERDERGRFAGEDDRYQRGGGERSGGNGGYRSSERYDRGDRGERSDRNDRGERYDRELWRGREGAREGWYSRENGGWSGGSSQSYRDRDDDDRRSQGGYRGSSGQERDDQGRFTSERDRGGGRQRGWEDEGRSSRSSSSRGGWRDRDEPGRFASEPDHQGRYHVYDDDRGTTQGMNNRGWDDERRGEPFGGQEGRSEGGYRSSHMQERDERGRFAGEDDRYQRDERDERGGRYGGDRYGSERHSSDRYAADRSHWR